MKMALDVCAFSIEGRGVGGLGVPVPQGEGLFWAPASPDLFVPQ